MSDLQPAPEPSLAPAECEESIFRCVVSHSDRAATWIRLGGELDLATAPQLRQILHQELTTARLIVIDLRQLSFMDSTGIQVIMAADKEARRLGRRLAFVRGPAQVQRLFDLIGLSDRLKIIDPTATQSPPETGPALPPDAA